MPKVVESILDVARWTPSGDNTQPWRFEILDEFHIAIHGFDTREYCLYDLNGFGSQLAHGALLETLRIAATGFGLKAEASRRPNAPEAHPIYDVQLHPDNQVQADDLLPYIERRCTQRRALSTHPLSVPEKQALTTSVGNLYTILWFEDLHVRWTMSRLLFDSAKIRLTIPEAYEVHRAVIQWNAHDSVDRIPDAAIGLDPVTLKLMRWAMGSWKRVSFLNRYLAGHLIPRIELDLLPALRCAGHFILLSNEQPSGIDNNVEAGRAVQRFWLTATKLGLQLQPEMTPLIFTRYVHQGISLSQVKSAVQQAEDVAALLERMTGNQSGRAIFMGRIGHGPPPPARSSRLSLANLELPADGAKG
jgi:hypothetical protein